MQFWQFWPRQCRRLSFPSLPWLLRALPNVATQRNYLDLCCVLCVVLCPLCPLPSPYPAPGSLSTDVTRRCDDDDDDASAHHRPSDSDSDSDVHPDVYISDPADANPKIKKSNQRQRQGRCAGGTGGGVPSYPYRRRTGVPDDPPGESLKPTTRRIRRRANFESESEGGMRDHGCGWDEGG
jgi:hypothetical protein